MTLDRLGVETHGGPDTAPVGDLTQTVFVDSLGFLLFEVSNSRSTYSIRSPEKRLL